MRAHFEQLETMRRLVAVSATGGVEAQLPESRANGAEFDSVEAGRHLIQRNDDGVRRPGIVKGNTIHSSVAHRVSPCVSELERYRVLPRGFDAQPRRPSDRLTLPLSGHAGVPVDGLSIVILLGREGRVVEDEREHGQLRADQPHCPLAGKARADAFGVKSVDWIKAGMKPGKW